MQSLLRKGKIYLKSLIYLNHTNHFKNILKNETSSKVHAAGLKVVSNLRNLYFFQFSAAANFTSFKKD